MNPPNIDLHCDLLYYLLRSGSAIDDLELGCSLPYLKAGNVKLQVMAIYAGTEQGSTIKGLQQSILFSEMVKSEHFFLFKDDEKSEKAKAIGIIAAIENASVFCGENDHLDKGFKNLETIISNTENILYIGITHHLENRFGGGNYSEVGLKEDGKVLIDYISDKKVAIDLAHTSDRLAYDILTYIDQRNYSIPILASHSNYRAICMNNRNLPDELAKEVIKRKGLIGLNFIKDYIDDDQPEKFYEHIQHGLDLGGESSMAYGADFFFYKEHPDTSRHPFFFTEHANASVYPAINQKIKEQFSSGATEKISHQNALDFIKRMDL